MSDTIAMATTALQELQHVFDGIAPDAADTIAGELLRADRIVCYGLGREGLMIRAFCMRLMHLGLKASMAGDVTTPPIGTGDLLFTSSGPGNLLMINSMIQLAHKAGAMVITITAQPDGADPMASDLVVHLPAQTMANDVGSESILPMGTAYEIAMLIFFDLVAIRLRELTGQTMDQLRARHYNLE